MDRNVAGLCELSGMTKPTELHIGVDRGGAEAADHGQQHRPVLRQNIDPPNRCVSLLLAVFRTETPLTLDYCPQMSDASVLSVQVQW